MAKKTRVAALALAMATPRMELVTASSTSNQAVPHSRLASRMTGASVEDAKLAMRLLPQPVSSAMAQTTMKTPSKLVEKRTARGRVRRGSRVSSASGATDSKPVKTEMEKTTA